MRADVRLSWAFLAASGLEVAGLFFDRRLLPYGGTLAIVFLIGLVLIRAPGSGRHLPQRTADRWSRRLTVFGLAALAVASALVSSETGAFVLPTAPADDPGLVDLALLTASGAAVAGAVLCRVERRMRAKLVPALLFGVLYVPIVGYAAFDPVVLPWEKPPDLLLRTLVLLMPLVAVLVLAFTANAALVSRGALRWAGAALLPVLALTMSVVPMVEDNALVSAVPDRTPASRWPILPSGGTGYAWSQAPRGGVEPELGVAAVISVELSDAEYEALLEATQKLEATRKLEAARNADPHAENYAQTLSIAAVPGPPGWSWNPWEGPIDWNRSVPAILAALLLLSLAAITTILFPRPVDAGD